VIDLFVVITFIWTNSFNDQ